MDIKCCMYRIKEKWEHSEEKKEGGRLKWEWEK
jgi:hypothetical protein